MSGWLSTQDFGTDHKSEKNHLFKMCAHTGPHSAVGKVPGNRCVSDCRSRGREFNPGPVPYFPGD